MFPNNHNVYLHDTPLRELFEKTNRSFSSGCIRIEKPIELAEYLLSGDMNIDKEFLLERIKLQIEESLYLTTPFPIHIVYFTAWVDSNGKLNFYEDIYERDQTLERLLSLPVF